MKALILSGPLLFHRAAGVLSLCAAVLALSLVAGGQAASPNQAEEMRKLDFLVGEWKGEGWQLAPDGSRQNSFSQKTRVQAKGGASILRVKDERTYKPVVSSGTPVYHSSTLDATVYYDDALKLYRWRGENSYARKNPLEAKLVGDRSLQYGMPFSVSIRPADGSRRTTIEVTRGGEWHETLEVWKTDRWYKVEESILKRVK